MDVDSVGRSGASPPAVDSVKAGVKQPARYYSTDSELLFSSIVVTADSEIEPSRRDEYRRAVMQHGGQWVDTSTDATTHIISPQSASDGPVVISEQRFRDSVAGKERLPFAIVDGQEVSAARRFCDALLAGSVALTVITAVDPNNRPQLPHLPYEILDKIFLMMKETLPAGAASLTTPPSFGRTSTFISIPSKHTAERTPTSVPCTSLSPRHFHPLLQHPSELFSALEELTLQIIPKSRTIYRPEFVDDFAPTRDAYFDGAFRSSHDSHDDVMDPGLHDLWRGVSPISGFRDAPRLRSVTVNAHMAGGFSASMLRLVSWTDLTDIDLRSISVGVFDIPDLLPQLTGARQLAIRVDGLAESSMPPMPQVTLPLTKLYWEVEYHHFDQFNVASCLAPLVLPHLETLELQVTDDRNRDTDATRMRKLASSICIRVLYSHCSISPSRQMSTLTLLNLRDSIAVDDKLLTFLMFDPHNPEPVLPVLEVLKLGNSGYPYRSQSPFSESRMMQKVESRWTRTPTGQAPPPLRSVQISAPHIGEGETLAHREVMDWVLQIAEEGLDIHYR
ncbi:hypothetical protein FB45DRAFT_1035635 [Roridomyces roridus]|uniref:BRCT domain-containing protein n=1 Tax=Roridomyces roridus TaxID=1738132 RepID=A0AAD7B9L1_9AGAR|nr:hypothetical protein FB45DRAFT_1035635 [Roridomyces roridus]